jgi:hypothetical protein
MARGKKYQPEQVVNLLRQIEVAVAPKSGTYTFTCTLSQLLKTTCFICFNLRATATHLKSADPYRSWGFKSPSGHHSKIIKAIEFN